VEQQDRWRSAEAASTETPKASRGVEKWGGVISLPIRLGGLRERRKLPSRVRAKPRKILISGLFSASKNEDVVYSNRVACHWQWLYAWSSRYYRVYWYLVIVIVKMVHVYVTFIQQQYVNIITVFCDEGKMSIMLRKMLKTTGHIASRQTFHRDAGQTGWKAGRPGENGTGGSPRYSRKQTSSCRTRGLLVSWSPSASIEMPTKLAAVQKMMWVENPCQRQTNAKHMNDANDWRPRPRLEPPSGM